MTNHDNDDRPDDALEPTEPLREMLESLAQNYHDGRERVEVQWTSETAHAKTAGDTPVVCINPHIPYEIHGATGPHALRMLANTTCHEVYHHNESKIDGKQELMERHDDGYAKLAGAAANILEDQYIDHQRLRDFRGLKQVQDWEIDNMMADDEMRPPISELDTAGQVIEGFTQLAFAGKVKGISEADPEVQAALDDIAPLCEQVKHVGRTDRREEMVEQAIERLKEVIPETPDLPDIIEELIEDLMDDLETDFDPDEAPDDESFDPDEAAEGEDGEGDGDAEDADADTEASDDAEADEDGDGDGDGDTVTDSVDEDGDGEGEGEDSEGDGDADSGAGNGGEGDGQGDGDTPTVTAREIASEYDPSDLRITK